MVDIDIRHSDDIALIIMHESWLDITTDCKDEVFAYHMSELRKCRLVAACTMVVTANHVDAVRLPGGRQ